MELIFAAMRIENQKYYKSVSGRYDYIVSDRGWLCHLAYTDAGVSPEFTDAFYLDLMASITGMPDMIYLLDIDPGEAYQRIISRGGRLDVIERRGAAYLASVARAYTQRAHDESRRHSTAVLVVDATDWCPDEMRNFFTGEANRLVGME
jgi:thymidylate kinase